MSSRTCSLVEITIVVHEPITLRTFTKYLTSLNISAGEYKGFIKILSPRPPWLIFTINKEERDFGISKEIIFKLLEEEIIEISGYTSDEFLTQITEPERLSVA